MTSSRRRFVGLLGGTSILGAAGFPAVASAAEPGANRDHAAPRTDTWDVSWVDRVTGKYRAVFDSPEVAEGAALIRAVSWCDMYKEVYGAERSEMSPVVVFRHAGISLIMGNEYWDRFEVGKQHKIKDSKGKWTKVNPISAAGADPAGPMAKYRLEKFLADGGVILACNWAFGIIVGSVQKKDKLDGDAARARAKELMIPGVILQPNGIFAALRAQEAGCRYVMAS
jgi:hypothetical protein